MENLALVANIEIQHLWYSFVDMCGTYELCALRVRLFVDMCGTSSALSIFTRVAGRKSQNSITSATDFMSIRHTMIYFVSHMHAHYYVYLDRGF